MDGWESETDSGLGFVNRESPFEWDVSIWSFRAMNFLTFFQLVSLKSNVFLIVWLMIWQQFRSFKTNRLQVFEWMFEQMLADLIPKLMSLKSHSDPKNWCSIQHTLVVSFAFLVLPFSLPLHFFIRWWFLLLAGRKHGKHMITVKLVKNNVKLSDTISQHPSFKWRGREWRWWRMRKNIAGNGFLLKNILRQEDRSEKWKDNSSCSILETKSTWRQSE